MRRARIMVDVLVPNEDDHLAVQDTIAECLETGLIIPAGYEVQSVEEVLT